MGALGGIGELINKNTVKGGRLFERGRLLEGGRLIESLRYSKIGQVGHSSAPVTKIDAK